jgi:hypothetical protein
MQALIAQLGGAGGMELVIVFLIFLLLALPLVAIVLLVAVLSDRNFLGSDDGEGDADGSDVDP